MRRYSQLFASMSSRSSILLFSIISSVAALSCGPAPAAQGPGADGVEVLSYAMITAGRPSGSGEVRIEPGGRWRTHYTFNDRGRGPDLRGELQLAEDGTLRTLRVTGHDYLKAPVDERLDLVGGALRWQSQAERGEAPAGAGFYVPLSDTIEADAMMTRLLLRSPGRRAKLLPSGEAWIEDETVREIEIAGKPVRLRRVAIAGTDFLPNLTWLDERGEVFASVSSWLSLIRAGAEAAIPALMADDNAWLAARAGRLAAELAQRPPAAGLAITGARLFDSERRVIIPDATVVVVGDRITAVGGPNTPVPAGARVIEARGRTLLPGLWDMHVHLADGSDGPLHLASGVTTVRDLGNDHDELGARMARFDAGTEIGPRVLRAGLIDGPGKFAAPTGTIAGTAESAAAYIAKFADDGVRQIKLYSSLDPRLVPGIAAETHRRGLRLSGHIPFGMNAAQAVEAGFDELQHVNFLFLQFLARPEDDTRTPVRFTRIAEGAASLDLAGPEVTRFLDLLVAHKTVLDPTVGTFRDMFESEPSDVHPGLAPFEARLPAQVVRSSRGGGLPAPDGKRALHRASYAAMLAMVKRAWDRKITIVAGTDDTAGLTFSHELELYVKAGIPAPDVLAIATIEAARVMSMDKELGSIAVGKHADLVLVDGDPTRDITTVRNTDAVISRGLVYDPAALFTSVGMRPRTAAPAH